MIMHMVHEASLSAIDLNLLVVLRSLLRERHVTRAASAVGLSQSATSHALARLRELCGDPLLVRRGKSFELTPRAARLLPILERGLSDLQAVVSAEPGFDPTTARRVFTLAMADYQLAVLLAPLLRELERVAPNVDLSVVAFPNLAEMLEDGSVDLALVSRAQFSGPFPIQDLFSDGFVCAVRMDHPRVKTRLSLDTYVSLRHVVVAPSGTPGSLVDTELARRGIRRRVAVRVSSFLVAPLVVAETDLVATLPARLARREAPHYGLRLLPPPLPLPEFTLAMAWHPRLEHDPAQRWLRDFVARVSHLGDTRRAK